jgi:general secretion pathway protein D
VQRQDVALKLSLTPHVNEGDFVRIELDQEVSDIASQNFNGLGPSTSKRTAKTVVVCKDTQTVVIGGLMSERQINAETKIPLLGDLPILGYLFKSTKKTMQKTNLLIVLRPTSSATRATWRIFRRSSRSGACTRRYRLQPEGAAQDVDTGTRAALEISRSPSRRTGSRLPSEEGIQTA